MTASTDSYLGVMDSTQQQDMFAALSFLCSQVMNGKWTIAPALVKAVHDGGIDGPPTVDVQPMVSQIDGYGQEIQHGTIYGLPVFRLQGGAWGIVTDPQVDDIGIMAVAMRDISAVVKTKAVALPGSRRTYAPSDGIYLGSILAKKLEQYVQFSDTGIKVLDKNGNTIELKSDQILITPKAGNPVMVAGDIRASGEITRGYGTGDQVTLGHHVHTSGGSGSPTSVPTPGT